MFNETYVLEILILRATHADGCHYDPRFTDEQTTLERLKNM